MRRALREHTYRSIAHRRIAIRLCDARHHRIDGRVIELAQCNDRTQSRQSIRMRRQSPSHHALRLMEQGWNVASTIEAQRLQNAAKQYLAEDAGSKYMSVTVELDRLLEVVSVIAGDVKKEADATLRFVTVALICASLTLSVIVLTLG